MDRGPSSGAADPAPTVEVLADLQAGLLDDATAARLRRRAREDPVAARRLAALDRVRRDLRHLATDAASAAPPPAAVTARVHAALRTTPRTRRLRRIVGLCGASAALLAVAVGAGALLREPSTVAPPPARPAGFPLSDAQLHALLGRPLDLGPLTDPQRRGSCLAGLGYPGATAVLGGTVIAPRGEPVVILLVPGEAPQTARAVAVRATCSSADTGLLAETTLDHA